MKLAAKRIYAAPAAGDGRRVLVDRLWPRGVSKQKARLDAWLREIAPSDKLRKWFGHDPVRWTEFKRRYSAELAGNKLALAALKEAIGTGPAVLLYSARDDLHNNAVALCEFLQGKTRLRPSRSPASSRR
ncbi:MAG TPA: DUF488 family protein [Opitutaceae bacterium]|jgi:uncharacterized protein YeaO (DUF488 family)|nr:DUF488 family protein [Opitutaceae bacterium]